MESGGNRGVELTSGQREARLRGWALEARLGRRDVQGGPRQTQRRRCPGLWRWRPGMGRAGPRPPETGARARQPGGD